MGKRRGSRPWTVICRFVRFKDKILQNAKKLKNTEIYIHKDFCKGTIELKKSIWEDFSNCRRQGKFAYLNYRSVVVRVDIFCFFVFCCFRVLLILNFKINVNTESQNFETLKYNIADNTPNILLDNSYNLNVNYFNVNF